MKQGILFIVLLLCIRTIAYGQTNSVFLYGPCQDETEARSASVTSHKEGIFSSWSANALELSERNFRMSVAYGSQLNFSNSPLNIKIPSSFEIGVSNNRIDAGFGVFLYLAELGFQDTQTPYLYRKRFNTYYLNNYFNLMESKVLKFDLEIGLMFREGSSVFIIDYHSNSWREPISLWCAYKDLGYIIGIKSNIAINQNLDFFTSARFSHAVLNLEKEDSCRENLYDITPDLINIQMMMGLQLNFSRIKFKK